jgi:dienelactone hydrolase
MRLAAFALCAACTSTPTGVTIAMHASSAPPAYGDTPFPTDAVRDGDHLSPIAGLDKVVGLHADLVVAHVAALDGFGLRPLVEFFVDGGDLDPDSIADGTAALVALDTGDAIAMDWHYDADRHVLAGSPASGQVLREGTTYAAYVTTALRTTTAAPLARSIGLDELGQLGARWRGTADAVKQLAVPDLAGIAVFTTQHATAPLLAARAAMDDRGVAPAPVIAFPDPSIIFSGQAQLDRLLGTATRATDGPRAGLERWGSDNPTGIAHDHVGVIGSGTITIVRFRGDDVGTNGPEDRTFQIDPTTGIPRVIAVETIPITFILPAAPPPATGYPVVIYGHGLGAGRDALEAFAEPITSQGYALVGIDMFGFGSRYDATDNGNNLAGKPGFTGDPTLRDGFGDTTGLGTTFHFFEGFLDVAAVRDGIRQSALDLGRVVEGLRASDLDVSALGANAKLDTSRIAYLGESFGTVVGTLFAATEPDIQLFVLDVPGGGILDLLLPASPEIGGVALPYIETIYKPSTQVDRWNPLIGLEQAVVDGGDPLSYAPHVLADRFTIGTRALGPRSVVCIEVVGDQVLSNRGTDALTRELGLSVLAPNLAPPGGMAELASPAAANMDGQTAVLVQYSPATHGANWSAEHGTLNYLPGFPVAGDDPFPKLPMPVTIDNPIYATYDQVDEILSTYFAGAAPRVRSTLAPIADFDDDGYPDAIDAYPYDPTRH